MSEGFSDIGIKEENGKYGLSVTYSWTFTKESKLNPETWEDEVEYGHAEREEWLLQPDFDEINRYKNCFAFRRGPVWDIFLVRPDFDRLGSICVNKSKLLGDIKASELKILCVVDSFCVYSVDGYCGLANTSGTILASKYDGIEVYDPYNELNRVQKPWLAVSRKGDRYMAHIWKYGKFEELTFFWHSLTFTQKFVRKTYGIYTGFNS